jgi:hypothetical protein
MSNTLTYNSGSQTYRSLKDFAHKTGKRILYDYKDFDNIIIFMIYNFQHVKLAEIISTYDKDSRITETVIYLDDIAPEISISSKNDNTYIMFEFGGDSKISVSPREKCIYDYNHNRPIQSTFRGKDYSKKDNSEIEFLKEQIDDLTNSMNTLNEKYEQLLHDANVSIYLKAKNDFDEKNNSTI